MLAKIRYRHLENVRMGMTTRKVFVEKSRLKAS